MLTILTLLTFLVWTVTELVVLTKHKQNMLNNGITYKQYAFLWAALSFYILPLTITLFHNHFSNFKVLFLLGAIVFTVPGIVAGFVTKRILFTSGVDIGVNSGNISEHIMYGGFGALIFCSIALLMGL